MTQQISATFPFNKCQSIHTDVQLFHAILIFKVKLKPFENYTRETAFIILSCGIPVEYYFELWHPRCVLF
jgi:hypothetical protein